MVERGCHWFWDRKIVAPAEKALGRIVRSARQSFLDQYLTSVFDRLSEDKIVALEASLADPRGNHGFQRLKDDVGAATLDNVLDAADRLAFIQSLNLPFDAISGIDPSWIKMLTRRAEGEPSSEMRRHGQKKRLVCWPSI